MGQEVKWNMVQLKGSWYAREVGGKRQTISLRTKDEAQAQLNMRLELGQEVLPEENVKHLELGKAHLNLVDPRLTKHTWGDLYKKWLNQKHLGRSTKKRREEELSRGVFPLLKERLLCDLTVEALVTQWQSSLGIFAKEFLRLIQNYAISLGWMVIPVVKPVHTKVHQNERRETRAITYEEHQSFVEHELASVGRPNAKHGLERADYYKMLWLTGAAQTDCASLTAENVDWKIKELVFYRKKTKERCAIVVAGELEALLKTLPKSGPLFPYIITLDQQKRGRNFRRHVKRLGLHQGTEKLTLHSYRYAMAELFAVSGLPIRDAQIVLGHSSKAVATAYAKKAKVAVRVPEVAPTTPEPEIIDSRQLVAA